MEHIQKIAEFVMNSFLQLWPYLLITIPLAVAVNLSGASKIIKRTLNMKPVISILLATVLGAFSPFCSCGVIPIISSLLIGGVPLAPVMSFWIASPSMDPEIFLLSTATIGWKLSIWRLVSTFVLSLGSGFLTQILWDKGMLGQQILRTDEAGSFRLLPNRLKGQSFLKLSRILAWRNRPEELSLQVAAVDNICSTAETDCCIIVQQTQIPETNRNRNEDTCNSCSGSCSPENTPFFKKLLIETRNATVMVVKFMGLAFLINALINIYVPEDFVTSLLDGNGPLAVITASLIGLPVYTSNTTALPFIGGLLELGMNQGAALAFLISGPTTTLPAMAAVWGIVKRKIFLLYLSLALAGSMIAGILFNLIS